MRKNLGFREWVGDVGVNLYTGCEHDCLYCYARANILRYRPNFEWSCPVRNKLAKLPPRKGEVVAWPTTHDFSPATIQEMTLYAPLVLAKYPSVLTVSKGRPDLIKRVVEAVPQELWSKWEWRITVTTCRESVAATWEPCAPSIGQRIETVKMLLDMGLKTSIACTPLLDVDPYPLFNLLKSLDFDTFWIEALNMPNQRIKDKDLVQVFKSMEPEQLKNIEALEKAEPRVKVKDVTRKKYLK